MSIEEKAKAYDEALEQAKKELNTCGSLDCDAARQIFRFFPELRKKPLTPFQQYLNFVLRKVHFASIPGKMENTDKFILDTVKKHTDELVALAKKHEYTDCQLRESEDEMMMREFNDWLCEEIECRTNDLRDEKDRRTLNMLCYVLTKFKDWLEKQKEQKPVEYPAGFYVTFPDGKQYYAKEMRCNGMNIKVVEPKPSWNPSEAVEGEVSAVILHKNGDEVHYAVTYPEGERPHSITDKVRMIICKKEN